MLWFPDNIQVKEERIGFSEAELAVIEEALRTLEEGNSLMIHNPLPCNRIPFAVCLAYARIQNPNFPVNGIIGRKKSLLVFPALSKGYVILFDNVKRCGWGKQPKLIKRTPIDSLSATREWANIHTAKHNFDFDLEHPVPNTGAIFVDLRKPEWGLSERSFDRIHDLFTDSDLPFIFYTDSITPEVEMLQERMDTVEISSELLATAEGMDVPNPGQTAKFAHLLGKEEFKVEHVTVGFREMRQVVPEMIQMKEDLREKGISPLEVSLLFNSLTKLPVQPKYWDIATNSNFFHQSIQELISNLRAKSQHIDGMDGELLISYCQAADDLCGLLNRKHPLQEELFELIREAEQDNIDRTVIVRNEYERKAIIQAITSKDGPTLSAVSIKRLVDYEAGESEEVVICRPFNYDSYAYEFPLAQRVIFLQFETWGEVTRHRVERGFDTLDADIAIRKIGHFEAKDPQSTELTDTLAPLRDEFEASRDTPVRGSSITHRDPDLQFTLSNGEVRSATDNTRVTVLRDNGDIARMRAGDLTVGQTVVLLPSITDDIYDLFIESAHQKEKIRNCESITERWRNELKSGLRRMTAKRLLKRIQEDGSVITNVGTVETWESGDALGPRDDEDVRRVLAAVDSEMEPMWEAAAQSMNEIRTEHRQIGKKARRAIESQASPTMASELSASIEGSIGRTNVRKATVEEISEL